MTPGPAPAWQRLDFRMEHQGQENWCWAATAVSVARFFDPETDWTQCAMANAELDETTCCVDGSAEACNRLNVLDAPMSRAEVLDRKRKGPVAYRAIRREIDAGRPLAVRVRWQGGGGHFAVIEGYRRHGGKWVAIDDPRYGQSDVTVAALTQGRYHGSGLWTHSYFTRRRPVA